MLGEPRDSLLTRTRIQATQLIGLPLYWINRNIYYSWMALTKQSFGLVITTMTQWWSPTVVRISGDASVAGQLRKTADGRAECDFPERLIMIANHQVGTLLKSLDSSYSFLIALYGLALPLVGSIH